MHKSCYPFQPYSTPVQILGKRGPFCKSSVKVCLKIAFKTSILWFVHAGQKITSYELIGGDTTKNCPIFCPGTDHNLWRSCALSMKYIFPHVFQAAYIIFIHRRLYTLISFKSFFYGFAEMWVFASVQKEICPALNQ